MKVKGQSCRVLSQRSVIQNQIPSSTGKLPGDKTNTITEKKEIQGDRPTRGTAALGRNEGFCLRPVHFEGLLGHPNLRGLDGREHMHLQLRRKVEGSRAR